MKKISFSFDYLIFLYLLLIPFVGNTIVSNKFKNEINSPPFPLSSISISTWLDFNHDGILNFSDKNVGGISLQLYNEFNNLVAIGTTDNNGYYTFSNLPNGKYRVKFSKFAGLTYTFQNIGNDETKDSDADLTGYSDFLLINTPADNYSITCGYKGNLQVFLGNNINLCAGESTELSANTYFGKDPFTYQWDNGLGNNRTVIVAPSTTTTYHVTVTDDWGFQAEGEITVRIKNGVGEEQFYPIDNFNSGSNPVNLYLQVSPGNPGPVLDTDYSPEILGEYRSVFLQFIAGINPASVIIDYNTGFFSHSNDVGTISNSALCYNSNGQGLDFDISGFDYFKFRDLGIDQGEVMLKITIKDINNLVIEKELKLPGLGSSVVYDKEVFFESITGFQNLDLEHISELCFEFSTEDSSIDFRVGDIGVSKFTDCEVKADPNSVELCYGDTIEIGATLECSKMVTFLWDKGLGYGDKQDVSPDSTTVYTVSVIDAYGCVSTDTVHVEVLEKPQLILPDNLKMCYLDSIEIEAIITGGKEPYSYYWSNGDTTKIIKISPISTTSISLIVADSNNCYANEQTVNIEVLPKPDVSVVTSTADCQESNGSAIASSTGGTFPYNYLWSNGYIGSDLLNIPTGSYTVTVTDLNGCTDTETALVDEKNCGLIGNYIWEDLNYDGIQNISEPGISNVMVELLDVSKIPMDTTFTDPDGYYYFNGLIEGDYFVKFYNPLNYFPTLRNNTSDDADSDADINDGFSELIQLAKYEKDSTIDAGYFKYAVIGDTVWVDKNGNGIQDFDEFGYQGMEVQLFDCNNIFIKSTLTDINGKYLFEDLLPGNYYLKFILSGDYKFTLSNQGIDINKDSDANEITGETSCELLISGESNLTYDAGIYIPASMGDFVWEDLNANGIQDSGEPGIGGVGVVLNDCAGNPLDTVYSSPSGAYVFDNLIPGNYKISIITPTGYYLSSPNATSDIIDSDIETDGFSICEFLESGENNTTYDVGLYRKAEIGNKVWIDNNGDGVQQVSESGILGAIVELQTCGGNYISSLSTDSQGNYLFTDLTPGSYRLKFYLPGDYHFTTKDIQNDSIDSDADIISGITICENLISGESNLTYDAGIYKLASLGDRVWLDSNGNGIQDSNESGFENVEVILQDCSGNYISHTFTLPDGTYEFAGLKPGGYTVKFVAPATYIFTKLNIGSDLTDSDADVNGLTACEQLESGEINLSYDAGLLYFGSLGDFVWEDKNGDGLQQSGEPGIANVTVKLYKYDNGSYILYKTTVTNYQGYYLFDELPPSYYYLKLVVPTDYEVTLPNIGLDDNVDSDLDNTNGTNTTKTINLSAGVDDMSWDFGLYKCATIGDLIWNDMIRNNIYDIQEGGIDGVLVNLWRKSGSNWVLWDYTYTSYNPNSTCGSGYWSFCTNPGEYYIQMSGINNTDFINVTPNVGSNESIDSDITGSHGINTSDSFVLNSGDFYNNLDGGFYKEHSLKGTAWIDSNSDGLQTSGETGLSGVMVRLYDSYQVVASQYTDASGNYQFNDIQAGAYYLKFSISSDYIFSNPNVGSDDSIDSDITHANGNGTTEWININNQGILDFDAGYIPMISPMIFNDIKAENRQSFNLINWSASNEQEIEQYEILRNADESGVFEFLSAINSKKSDYSNYDFHDFDISKIGTYRYKIKAVANGSNIFSNEVVVDVNMGVGIRVYPNPTSSSLFLMYFGHENDIISYYVVDVNGIIVIKSENVSVSADELYSHEINETERLSSGVYQVIIKNSKGNLNTKFVKVD